MPYRLKLRGVAALLLAVAAPLAAQDGPRIDPALRPLMRAELRPSFDIIAGQMAEDTAAPPVVGNLALRLDGGEPRVGIFAHVAGPEGVAELESLGARVDVVLGNLVAASLPIRSVPALVRARQILRVEAARMVTPVLDSAMHAIRADEVRQRVGQEWIGFTGRGSLVGIYDTGVDFRHPDFIDPAGSTRVEALWDQTGPSSNPPPGFTFGAFCSRADVQGTIDGLGTCAQRDRNGHGTHVAGAAAGDGSAANPGTEAFRYAGVAPDAELLVVKGGNSSFSESNIIAGLRWMTQHAGTLGKPAVANLSLGGQAGARDGTRLYEQMIDSLSAPGFIVAVAAGNDGSNRNSTPQVAEFLFHAKGVAEGTTPREFTVRVPSYTPSTNGCQNFALFELWYEAADRLTIEVGRPDGTSLSVAHGDSASSASANGFIFIWNAAQGADPANGDFEGFIEVSGCDASSGNPQPGTWRITVTPEVTGSGQEFHMWMSATDFGEDAAAGIQGFDNASTVSSPGVATRAVTVGAVTTRNCLPNIEGDTVCSTVTQKIGDIAYFSGTGPTRDGRLKPEIAAPGRFVLSALSSDANAPSIVITPDGQHWALQGTSMATPIVTGSIALFYEIEPSLTPEDVKALFSRTAIRDAFSTTSTVMGDPGGSPNFQWGFGKLDVRAGFEDLGAFGAAATLAISATPLPPPASVLSAAGTRIPLLKLHLSASGPEAIDVLRLGFEVVGRDPGAELVVARDANGNGALDTTDPVLESAPAGVAGLDTAFVDFDGLRVPENGAVDLIVAIELSGAVPNAASFRLTYLPDEARTIGVASRVAGNIEQSDQSVASEPVRTTVLTEGEVFALSENPIRSGRVILNFSTRPQTAAIYTLSGRRVIDLTSSVEPGGGRVVWRAVNGDGDAVAPGIYLLVVVVDGQQITEKLVIAPGGNEPGQEE